MVIPFEVGPKWAGGISLQSPHVRPESCLEPQSEYSKELHRKEQILANMLIAMVESREVWFRTDNKDSLGGLVVKVYLDAIEGMIKEFQEFQVTSMDEPEETSEEVTIRWMEEFLEAFINAEDMWLNPTHWDTIGIRQDKDGSVHFPNAMKKAFLAGAKDILDERRKIKRQD